MQRFANRLDAGLRLAAKLAGYAHRRDVLVLGLPRGGIPVAHAIATRLGLPLEVVVVRKLGVPGNEELAMGALASGGVRVVNEELGLRGPALLSAMDEVTERELAELNRREQKCRAHRPPPDLRGKTVILVDDGIATGATMRAAVEAVRRNEAGRIVVAVPVGPESTCARLALQVDELVCLESRADFDSVGQFYEDFSQTSDMEVQKLLRDE